MKEIVEIATAADMSTFTNDRHIRELIMLYLADKIDARITKEGWTTGEEIMEMSVKIRQKESK